MEHTAEIEAALGKQNVSLLINECMKGSIDKQQMKDISIALHPRVHGRFKQRREEGKRCDFHELRRILDDWFIFELYEEEMKNKKGLPKLIRILEAENIELSFLARKMK